MGSRWQSPSYSQCLLHSGPGSLSRGDGESNYGIQPLGLPPYRVWPGGKGNAEWPERVRGLMLTLPGRGKGQGLVTLLFFSPSAHLFIDSFHSLKNVSCAGPGDQKYKSRDFPSD